ncbi:MAG TPA: hypothetical protein VFI19_11315 [Nocardioides sp.]|nr:hypothetical protein [Nocardioides sp.]
MTSRPQRRERDVAVLIDLLVQVQRARSACRAGRALPVNSTTRLDQAERTAQLAQAMEAYADAAASVGVPLPYRYRDELRLYQAMKRAPYDISRSRAGSS